MLSEFSCFYCHNLPRTPMLCNNKNCDGVFCKFCMNKIQFSGIKVCPKCFSEFSPETAKLMKNARMVQMFLLIDQLKLKIKCKNYQNGCEFISNLTENINKRNNQGFTLNNHEMRNHELVCTKCPDCKSECEMCKVVFLNSKIAAHKQKCP